MRFLTTILVLALAALVIAAGQDAAPNRPISFTHAGPGEKAPNADGFMQRWLILEPIRVVGQLTDSAVQATVKKDYFPKQLTVLPNDGDQVTVNNAQLTWHAIDTKDYNVNLYHFAHAFNKPSSDVLFWAVTIVNCPEEVHEARLAIGSNAASVWWVNGKEVIDLYLDRQTVIDDGVSKRLTLKKGRNIVRCAVINAGGATDFCARFLDKDDKPITGFSLTLDPGAK